MKSTEIRKRFIDFFVARGHTYVPSSPLIPADDPTLLFANAGMNQFKDVFLGKEKRSYTRAVSVQKCIRAGGKHNDLENVGFTARHLTFFEMLGNFSFGDYFKHEAIRFAWDFLTKDIGLDANKLYPSVYKLDDEAYTIWNKEIGVPAERIVRLGEADNFWQMGDVGPCGPCTEIYIDRGAGIGCGTKDCGPGCSCDRFLEIWNNVFMQFDRQAGGVDKPLKQTGVDTGMGLERLCMVVEGKDSVYDTDLFALIFACIEKLVKKSYGSSPEVTAAMRVIADHIRSSSFAIADGCMPSNEGRGYVLRKIIRRAALFAQKLSSENFFPQVYYGLAEAMGEAYPELITNKQLILNVLTSETEKFSHNLVSGQAILQRYFESSTDKIISGAQAFKLYDTYGFPLELTKVIAQEKGYTVDVAGFEKEMEHQRVQSGKKQETAQEFNIDESLSTFFTGYDELETKTEISEIVCHGVSVDTAPAQETCWFVTPRSPLYVECGGQISDTAYLRVKDYTTPILAIKKVGNAIAFEAKTSGDIKKGSEVTLIVDRDARTNTMKNHTATHLLQAALLQVVGKTVKQAGSLVTPDYLRFDFTHHENLTPEQIKAVEDIVNQKIMENIQLDIAQTTLKDATARGVIAFFGEKYNPDKVRVVAIPGFSAELCGGTHVRATGDIGVFKIIEVAALSAGSRRIVALTGPAALAEFQQDFTLVKKLSQEFKMQPTELAAAVAKQRDVLKDAQNSAHKLKQQLYKLMVPQWLAHTEMVGTLPYGYITLDDVSASELRDIAQSLLQAKPGLYVLVASAYERFSYMIVVAPEFVAAARLKELANSLKSLGLKGGATDVAIQGGGTVVPENLKEVIRSWIIKK